jgi:hypothetical protein
MDSGSGLAAGPGMTEENLSRPAKIHVVKAAAQQREDAALF